MFNSIFRNYLIILGLLLTVTLSAQAGQKSKFLGIAKHDYGTVVTEDQSGAIDYCAHRGSHLPSIRELDSR